MKAKRSYTAIYQINNEQREVKNIYHMPIMDTIVKVPDGSNQYGKVISVKKDTKNA
jgi:hypothetical protein